MYKYILKNKLTFLSIAFAIIIYTFMKYKKEDTEQEVKVIQMEPVPSIKKLVETEVVTDQINDALEKDKANFLIDNELLAGKIELPEVEYTDPAISDLLVPVINEQDDKALEKYMKGSVVFNETVPSHTECYKYVCMPGSYTQCTNNVYSNSNKKCECKVIDACRKF